MNRQKIININENEIAYYDKTCIFPLVRIKK